MEDPYEQIDRILTESPKFERRVLAGIDYDNVQAWISAGIEPESIIQGIIKTLENFRPSPQKKTIRSMAYFQPQILEAESQRRANQR